MKEFFKGKKIKIVIQNKSFKGKEFVDIRQYYNDAKSNEFKPSAKGVTIPLNQFQEFKEIFITHSETDKDNHHEPINDNNEEGISDKILSIAKKLSSK